MSISHGLKSPSIARSDMWPQVQQFPTLMQKRSLASRSAYITLLQLTVPSLGNQAGVALCFNKNLDSDLCHFRLGLPSVTCTHQHKDDSSAVHTASRGFGSASRDIWLGTTGRGGRGLRTGLMAPMISPDNRHNAMCKIRRLLSPWNKFLQILHKCDLNKVPK